MLAEIFSLGAEIFSTSAAYLFLFIAVALLFFLIGFFVSFISTGKLSSALSSGGLVFVFSFIALVTGYITGNSRTTVTGDVLPVLLSGLGGLFALGIAKSKIDKALVSVGSFSFATAIFLGISFGSINREKSDNVDAAVRSVVEQEYIESLKKLNQDWKTTTSRFILELQKSTSQPTPPLSNVTPNAGTSQNANVLPVFNCASITSPELRRVLGCDAVYIQPGLQPSPPLSGPVTPPGPTFFPPGPTFDNTLRGFGTLYEFNLPNYDVFPLPQIGSP